MASSCKDHRDTASRCQRPISHQPASKAKTGLAFVQVSQGAETSKQDKGAPSPSGAKARSQTACRNFLTEKGCQRGAKCGFAHDINCGSTQHCVADCKAPKPEASGKGGSKGGGTKGGPKQDGKANPAGALKHPSPSPKTAPLAAPSTQPAPELSPKATDSASNSSQHVRLQTMIAERIKCYATCSPVPPR